jgi:hypothetical protein
LRAKSFFAVLSLTLVSVFCGSLSAKVGVERIEATSPALRLLSDRIGDFEARGSTSDVTVVAPGELEPAAFDITARAGRDYFSRDGRRFVVYVATTRSDPAAYSLLTYLTRSAASAQKVEPLAIGTAGARVNGTIYFFRGPA